MDPEIWVGIAAVFVSGGAVGAALTLLMQWVGRKLDGGPTPARALGDRESAALRAELGDLARQVENLDARLEFQEQLLGGGTPITRPPARLERAGDEREG